MKRYPNYSDSETFWIDKMPEHWQRLKTKRIFKEVSIKNHQHLPLLSVTQDRGVISRNEVEGAVMPTKDLQNFKLIEKGDFVISLRAFQGGIEYSEVSGIVSPAYSVIKNIIPIHSNFYKFLFKSQYFISALAALVTGIRDGQNIDIKEFGELIIPYPPIEEQVQIANMIEEKIDKAIAKAEKELELMKEYRNVFIAESVIGKIDITSVKEESKKFTNQANQIEN